MALLLGLDTGGTFTDAALLDMPMDGSQGTVVAKAKSLTTRHDLAIGLAGAAEQALADAACDPGDIALVSLSTTLATNALVEGQGGRVALIAIGFAERDLEKAGLSDALGQDPVIVLQGGHGTHGHEAKPLDMAPLETKLEELAETVSGFAVAGYFAVRNPAHELAVRDLILEKTGKAVTCSHELSARLNGPKRALTTVLNARLVPMITQLISATRRTLEKAGIKAPVMVVRGDGALVAAEFASRRPIETILSGPAASLVGARYLTGEDDAFVCDIGGTTSDVAVLADGKPKLDDQGAMVGGYRTMVEAVAMHTFGLGGDSEVSIGGNALKPEIALGPRRLVPISLLAHSHSDIVHEALDKQLKSTLNGRHDGRFAFRSGAGLAAGLSDGESRLWEKIVDAPVALEQLLQGTSQAAALSRLVERGLVMISGLTPSDAMHVLGDQQGWDKSAADKALRLFGRRRDGAGQAFEADPNKLAGRVVAQVQKRSAEVVLETAFNDDGEAGAEHVQHTFVQSALIRRQQSNDPANKVDVSISLKQPLIGLGASAFQYHPEAARLLATDAIVPQHADVANAIGAVVGQISVQSVLTVSQPGEGQFVVTGIKAPFTDEAKAFAAAEKAALAQVSTLAVEAGADEFETALSRDERRANVESRDTLVEATITAVATGRPSLISAGD